MKVNGAFTEALNAQAVSDSKHGLVVAAEVTGEVNDYGNFDLMIDEVKQNASKAGEVDLKETKYVFDSGYYSVENIVKADKDELDVYIADSKDKNIYEDIELTKPNGKISSRECTIVKKEEQIYLRCPGEIEIPLSGKKRNRHCTTNL